MGDGDAGPNTGGVGAWSPLPFLGADFADEVARPLHRADAVGPRATTASTTAALLYAGLMVTPEGPKLIEYNIRFGDPDSAGRAAAGHERPGRAARRGGGAGASRPSRPFADDAAVLVVALAEGYPGPTRTGDAIEGLEAARAVEGVEVLMAGVALRRAMGGS